MAELTGGAFFDTRVRDWVNFIFEKDPNNPSTIIVHADHLALPEGIEQYSSSQESMQRNEIYNIQALLNAYRMRQLCAVDNLLTSSESLLHAHAELFLSKGYAAWNLTGKSKVDFEDRLKRFTDPTLSTLFMGDAPVCSTQENEILQASELRERVLELERENVNFKAISEQAAEEMADLSEKLQQKTEQIHLMEIHLNETILSALSSKQQEFEKALSEKNQELEKLRGETDLIVATALQEHHDSQLQTVATENSSVTALEEYSKNLEKRNKQLEHLLLVAKDALMQSKAEKSIIDSPEFKSRQKASGCILQ
jgi:hypothetical protein